MRLGRPLSGDFDPTTKTLTLTGRNSIGKQSSVDLHVDDADAFIAWIAEVLFEKGRSEDGAGRALVVDRLGISFHDEDDGGHCLVFTFGYGRSNLSFQVSIQASAPQRIAAIKAHLEQAMAEMGNADRAPKQ